MKPKYSTGYLTPQVNRIKRNVKPRHSESQDDSSVAMDINDSLFEKLMNCPIKRQLVINLIESEKDNIETYKRQQEQKKKGTESPLSKVQKRHVCESPTALLRRRALERQERQSPLLDNDSASRSNSRQSSVSSGPSPIPFNKLLDGVIAYVEIKSKDEDRSKGAKILMRTMGAVVRDQFTKDVTHVVFKDGSFTTYQKAKLMNVHLVSVLWIEAVRSSNTKVSEKRFPALGTEAYDHNVSSICSQMQKDYEEIIRDELRLSLATGTPLPSTQSFIDRRRTIMTPAPSSSRFFSQEFESSQDREVRQITQRGRKTDHFCRTDAAGPLLPKTSPELTDDDSDLSPFINGSKHRKDRGRTISTDEQVIINSVDSLGDYSTNTDNSKSSKDSSKAAKDIRMSNVYGTSMDLTMLDDRLIIDTSDISTKENDTPNVSDNSIYYKNTPKLKSEISDTNLTAKRSADLFNKPDESFYKRRTRQLRSSIILSDNSRNVTNETFLKDRDSSHSTMSSLQLSHQGLQILSKKTCSTNVEPSQRQQKDLARSSLQVSKEHSNSNAEKSGSTNMSSLHVSSDSNKAKNNTDENILNKIAEKSSSTNMSVLLISSDSVKDKTDRSVQIESNINCMNLVQPLSKVKSSQNFNTNTSNDSFSPLNSNLAKELLHTLDEITLPDGNVTKRRGKYSTKKSITSTTKRKTLSQNDNATDSDSSRKSNKVLPDGTSPTKKIKTVSNSDDISVQTPRKNDVEADSDSSKRNVGDRRKTTNMKGEPGVKKPSPNDSHSGLVENSGSDKKGRKLRKLYNPEESIQDIIESDEQEREDKRTKVNKQKSHDGVILNPSIICIRSNILLTSKAKDFVDRNNIDIQAVLNRESEESEPSNTSTNRAKKKNKEKKVTINSDDDEQQELAEEFINKKKTNKFNRKTMELVRSEGQIVKRRQSIRLSQRARKKLNLDSSTSSTDGGISKRRKSVKLSQRPRRKPNLNSSTSSNDKTIIPITPTINRRSTMEFQTLSQMSAKKRLKIDKNKRPSIVCTKMHKDDIQVFNQIVRKLGGFIIEDEVSNKTTHLVAGEAKRTINMLRAITMGCWVLKHEWLLKSLEEGKWLREEDYEETDFSPAVQQCRLQRQAFGPSYSMDIFQHCEPIYIARGSIPRCSDLRELVSLCKGKVVTIPRNAGIVVGELVRHEDVKCVKETWVLDSITFNKKMPLKKYIIAPSSDSPSV